MAGLDDYNGYLVFPFAGTQEWKTLTTDVETGGLGIRRKKWANKRYRFSLLYHFPTLSAAQGFASFVDGTSGAADTFTWTNPLDAGSYTCRVAADAVEIRWEGPNSFGAELTILGVPVSA